MHTGWPLVSCSEGSSVLVLESGLYVSTASGGDV